MKHTESSAIVPCHLPSRKTFQNLTGKTFSRLTVSSLAGTRNDGRGQSLYFWNCGCKCGASIIVLGASLKSGNSTSCGCIIKEKLKGQPSFNKTHGMAGKPEYVTWCAMIARCINPKLKCWKRYGGRGIKVCERWRNSFDHFYADMGPRPTGQHSIDRFPNLNGNYEPSNCRWATKVEQCQNQSSNHIVELGGKAMCIAAWAKELGINKGTISRRLRAGWTAAEALTKGDARFKL